LSRQLRPSPPCRDLAAELRKSWTSSSNDAARSSPLPPSGRDRTPFCRDADFDSFDDHAVTIRERDARTQERVAIDAVSS